MLDIHTIKKRILADYDEALRKSSSTATFHSNFRDHISGMASEFNRDSLVEYKLYNILDENRIGSVDVVWLNNGSPSLAIEIDSHYRKKSIIKLASFQFCYKLWIYYGRDELKKIVESRNIPASIYTLQVPTVTAQMFK